MKYVSDITHFYFSTEIYNKNRYDQIFDRKKLCTIMISAGCFRSQASGCMHNGYWIKRLMIADCELPIIIF